MGIDEQISALGSLLDGWFDEMIAKIDSGNKTAQAKAWLAGIEITKQFDDLKKQGSAALSALLNPTNVASESERVSALLRAFEFAAKLEATLSDEMADVDGVTQIDHLMDDIIVALAPIGYGRTFLVPLLEHDDARVRAFAGRYLIDLIPDRVIPVMEKIEEEKRGSCADFCAYWAVRTWQIERRARFKRARDPSGAELIRRSNEIVLAGAVGAAADKLINR
jgi:hypothetical protein